MAPESKIGTLVVGLGRIGWMYHIKAAAANPHFKIVGGVDIVPERRKECEDTYGCPSFDNIDAALAATKPELVVVATRSRDHCEHTIKSLEAGAHVHVDKPAAMNLEEFDRMLAAAKKAGRLLSVNQSLRALADTRFVRETIDSGKLGKVFWIRRSGTGTFYRRNDWQMEKQYGGGLFYNGGVHLIDAVLRFADTPIVDVWGDLKHTGASSGDADDFVRVAIRTEDGRLIEVSTSYSVAIGEPTWLVAGNCGTMTIEAREGAPGIARLKYFDPAKAPARPLEGPVPIDRRYRIPEELPWVEETVDATPSKPWPDWYENLYEAVRKGGRLNVSGDSVHDTLRVMDMVRASSQWKY